MIHLANISSGQADHAIEIADRVFWVGHHQDDDVFQCHVYLIEHGDQSIIFDPGSLITFPNTLRKIQEVTSLSNIRYFVCQHQDPDITASLPIIDQLNCRSDTFVVTHWRAKALLRHYNIKIPFWLVDEHEWHLDLGGRLIRFVFTPYAHFPGAFCSFDEQSQVLFSSDIFGGFTDGFSLVAQDEGYFESLRPFHEHYMPSRDILSHAMAQLEPLPIELIAPQHGSIIPKQFVRFFIERLKQLDCGLYLLAKQNTDIQRLSRLNSLIRNIGQTMITYRDFRDIASALLKIAQALLPVDELAFYVKNQEGKVLYLAPESRYRGALVEPPEAIAEYLGIDTQKWQLVSGSYIRKIQLFTSKDASLADYLMIPLFTPAKGTLDSIALLRLASPLELNEEIDDLVHQMAMPLQVAVEREAIYRTLDFERQQFYESSIRDPLTNLFTRFYMQDTVGRLCTYHDRDSNARVGLILVDIDHFKLVNDTYGHNQGDVVLRHVADVLIGSVREGDLPVRLGGEEFAVFVAGQSVFHIDLLAERLRQDVAALQFEGAMQGKQITISAGVALRHQGETIEDFIHRADQALYEAKHGGRNRICHASE